MNTILGLKIPMTETGRREARLIADMVNDYVADMDDADRVVFLDELELDCPVSWAPVDSMYGVIVVTTLRHIWATLLDGASEWDDFLARFIEDGMIRVFGSGDQVAEALEQATTKEK